MCMIEIRSILCPIDFSDFSRHALDHAAAIAKWYQSTITVFNVCPLVPAMAFAPATPMLPLSVPTPDDLHALLASMTRFAEGEMGASVPLRYEIAEGDPVTQILDRAVAIPSDLLVLGTHGRSGFQRLVLGSVTEKVLRKASCPVLTVPKSTPDAVPTPPLFKHIVCAVDFSDCSVHALTYAISLAREADADLTLVHVIEVPTDGLSEEHETALTGPRALKDYIAAVEEERAARVRRLVPQNVGNHCRINTLMATGKPYREIMRIASERKTELIVIGIHGRGAADLAFFGSTAQHIVRQAACPVLTIRKG